MFFRESRRVRELEEDLAETQREVKSLRVEWDETYEKLLKLYRKTAAERAKLAKHDSPEPETVEEDSSSSSNGSGSFLTPKQRLIQQQILQRRGAQR